MNSRRDDRLAWWRDPSPLVTHTAWVRFFAQPAIPRKSRMPSLVSIVAHRSNSRHGAGHEFDKFDRRHLDARLRGCLTPGRNTQSGLRLETERSDAHRQRWSIRDFHIRPIAPPFWQSRQENGYRGGDKVGVPGHEFALRDGHCRPGRPHAGVSHRRFNLPELGRNNTAAQLRD